MSIYFELCRVSLACLLLKYGPTVGGFVWLKYVKYRLVHESTNTIPKQPKMIIGQTVAQPTTS